MKFVYIKITDDVGKNKIENFNVSSICSGLDELLEFSFSLEALNKRVFEHSSGIKKLFGKLFDLKLNRTLAKLYDKNEQGLYVILPRAYMANSNSGITKIRKYILKMFYGHKFKLLKKDGNIVEHLQNYLEEAIVTQGVTKQDAKIVMIYNDARNIDFNLVREMIDKYKYLNIYTNTKNTKEYIKRLDDINKEYGSSSTITNGSIKILNSYDICILFDVSKRAIFNKFTPKKPYILDISDSDSDKFNDYLVRFKKSDAYSRFDIKKLNYLFAIYGKVTVAYIMCKILGDA